MPSTQKPTHSTSNILWPPAREARMRPVCFGREVPGGTSIAIMPVLEIQCPWCPWMVDVAKDFHLSHPRLNVTGFCGKRRVDSKKSTSSVGRCIQQEFDGPFALSTRLRMSIRKCRGTKQMALLGLYLSIYHILFDIQNTNSLQRWAVR